MHRREFITLLGGAAAALPAAAGQHVGRQLPTLPVIGYLGLGPVDDNSVRAPFLQGLRESGFVEGRNVKIEYRLTEQFDQMFGLAADLVRHEVNLIFASNTVAAIAAKVATTTIPVVFVTGVDPVDFGLVASLSRPGGNATGVTISAIELEGKRLGLLHESVRAAQPIAALLNRQSASVNSQEKALLEAARTVRRQIRLMHAATEREIDEVFTTIAHDRAGGLTLGGADPFFYARRNQIVALAAHYEIPTIYSAREFTRAGGLISYGADDDVVRYAGIYAGRILKGEKAADLPVIQPTRFELVINLKTAKRLDLDLPPTVLALADEVIE